MSNTRRVTINPTVKVEEVLSIHDYTAKEVRASWYDEDEMNRITQRCFKILQKIESGTKASKYCVRGLEGHTSVRSVSKRNNRTAAYTAVLEEQQRQWNENEVTDVQAISDAYRCTTSSCQMWAQVVGIRDQRAVEAYLYDDNDEEEERETKSALTVCSLSQDSRVVQAQTAARTGNFSARAA